MTSKTEPKQDNNASTEQPPEDGKWQPASWPGQVWSDVHATGWRLRRQLVPHAVAAAIGGIGVAAHAIAAHGAAPGQLAAILAGVSFPAALWLARRAKRRKPRWAKRVLWGGLLGAGWLATAPYGMGPEQIAFLLAGELAVSARWWQHHRPGYPDRDAPAEPEQQSTRAQQIVADWDAFIACDGGPLPRSVLISPEATKHTIAFDLQLWRGKQTLAAAIAAIDKIATGLDVGVQDLIIESHPTRSDAWCRLQVVTDSPIAGDLTFTGPRRRGGYLGMGPYADGTGEAEYRLYTPGSMWSGVVIGGTGSGKSRLVENLVISALAGGDEGPDTVFWYLDPQHGGSSPALAEHADWFCDLDNADDMLDAGLALLDARGQENAAEGWTGFTPTPERPGVLIGLEECHATLADPNKAAKWARIAREGRKVGIALILISQYPGLETFGGKEALRSSVMEGNAIVLRSTSNQTKGLMAGLQVDPKTLPRIPGYAYVNGNEAIGQRTAPFRNRDTGEVAGEWLAAQPKADLDLYSTTATLAAGTEYRDRHEVASDTREVAKAFVEALRRGEIPDRVLRRARAGRATTAAVGDLGQIIEFPGPITVPVQQGPGMSFEEAVLALTPSHRLVLGSIMAGNARPHDICNATGLSRRHVHDLLAGLLRAGYVTKSGSGPAVQYQTAA
jgi:hypothetical protein